jgi:hypothetical protein
VPLNSLEAEVRDLSNMALYEARPIRFHVLAGAGKVALGEDPTQEREVFSELAANGQVSLYPAPRGWARSSMSVSSCSRCAASRRKRRSTSSAGCSTVMSKSASATTGASTRAHRPSCGGNFNPPATASAAVRSSGELFPGHNGD